MRFYLGAPEPSWLARSETPMCVSYQRLRRRKSYPRALGAWVMDSGAFTEIDTNHRWTISPAAYAAAARTIYDEIGGFDWAGIQDWMCEPHMVEKTGRSIREHQERSVASYLELRALDPGLPWLPTLQGWEMADYLRCLELYAEAGVDLRQAPAVGLGSVCRRQSTQEIADIVFALSALGLRLHGFGVKAGGLRQSWPYLASADSMAWSFRARRDNIRLPGCTHKNCNSCLRWAEQWAAAIRSLIAPVQARMV